MILERWMFNGRLSTRLYKARPSFSGILTSRLSGVGITPFDSYQQGAFQEVNHDR